MAVGDLAYLKRTLKAGAQLQLVAFSFNDKPAPHKYLNVVRNVVAPNTVGFGLVDPADPAQRVSYLDWPKAKDLTINAGDCSFAVRADGAGGAVLTYRIVS